jgi:polygalacturonase
MKQTILLCGLAAGLMAVPMTASADSDVSKEKASQNTPQGWQAVELPSIAAITDANALNIKDYGASTTSADNTAAIQRALDAVPQGGGMVVVPAGTWLCGPLQVKAKTVLHLAAGATLRLLSYGTYPSDNGNYKTKTFLANRKNASDIIIEGEGTTTSIIDGQGAAWWKAVEQQKFDRPALVRFSSGSRFLVRNMRFENSPGVNVTIGQSGKGSHGTVHDVVIREPSSSATTGQKSHNTDGIPIWAPYVNVYNCDISNGDDNVVVDSDGQYVHVWNCKFGTGHGASIGSFTERVHDVLWEDISFRDTDSGFRLKSQRGRSGQVYNITMRNCTMQNVMNPIYIECWYDKSTKPEPAQAPRAEPTATTPAFHDILIQHVTATATPYKKSDKAAFPVYIYGLPESHVRRVTLDDVHVDAKKGMFLAYCDVTFTGGCNIKNLTDSTKYMEKCYQANVTGTYDGSGATAIVLPKASKLVGGDYAYTLLGAPRSQKSLSRGVYIVNHHKVLVR